MSSMILRSYESDTNFTTTVLPWQGVNSVDWLGVSQSGRLAAAERRLLKADGDIVSFYTIAPSTYYLPLNVPAPYTLAPFLRAE
ncbi:uncharacterized protein ARMOST_22164 [Armillaria ostoyae]|uniref:Uncharacterized protein n=1 Tax=Armillaria ostoyae TaxID=47428 RepID=A0A284SC53_ARMOS|nr:uncharacterized protein ARMOST_22164 [Armillaria ostoyae]